MTEQTAFPLSWPTGKPRTRRDRRKRANFSVRSSTNGGWSTGRKLTVAEALSRLLPELRRIRANNHIISTDVELRLDGAPRSGRREPDDPGAAVYFELGEQKKPHVLACDRFTRVADNIAAVAAHIEATRKIERCGVGTLEQSFVGYLALPAKGATSAESWWDILGVAPAATREEVRRAYRAKALVVHPDHGGSPEAFSRLAEATKQALSAGGNS